MIKALLTLSIILIPNLSSAITPVNLTGNETLEEMQSIQSQLELSITGLSGEIAIYKNKSNNQKSAANLKTRLLNINKKIYKKEGTKDEIIKDTADLTKKWKDLKKIYDTKSAEIEDWDTKADTRKNVAIGVGAAALAIGTTAALKNKKSNGGNWNLLGKEGNYAEAKNIVDANGAIDENKYKNEISNNLFGEIKEDGSRSGGKANKKKCKRKKFYNNGNQTACQALGIAPRGIAIKKDAAIQKQKETRIGQNIAKSEDNIETMKSEMSASMDKSMGVPFKSLSFNNKDKNLIANNSELIKNNITGEITSCYQYKDYETCLKNNNKCKWDLLCIPK